MVIQFLKLSPWRKCRIVFSILGPRKGVMPLLLTWQWVLIAPGGMGK